MRRIGSVDVGGQLKYGVTFNESDDQMSNLKSKLGSAMRNRGLRAAQGINLPIRHTINSPSSNLGPECGSRDGENGRRGTLKLCAY